MELGESSRAGSRTNKRLKRRGIANGPMRETLHSRGVEIAQQERNPSGLSETIEGMTSELSRAGGVV